MSIVKTKVNGGRVEFRAPQDWPEGAEIEARPVETVEDKDRMSPVEIERTLKAMEDYFRNLTPEDVKSLKEVEQIIKESRKKEKELARASIDQLGTGWE